MMMVVMADNNAEDGEMAATVREILGGVDNYKSQLAKAMSIEQARDVLAQRDTPVSSMTLTAAFSMIRSRVKPAEYLAFVVDLTDSVFAVASQYGLSPRLSERERQDFREGMTTAFLNECGVDPSEWVKASRWK
jgi:AraC-like DNA-binding protein